MIAQAIRIEGAAAEDDVSRLPSPSLRKRSRGRRRNCRFLKGAARRSAPITIAFSPRSPPTSSPASSKHGARRRTTRPSSSGAFRFSCIVTGNLVVALQPDRGARAERHETYHDMQRPPRHAYVAFYLWLRHIRKIDALIHLGAHGTLEWLPGKSVMLSQTCAPEVVLGPTPLIYPFIVNDPGEAAQAKRRASAVTIGHLTPPLVDAELFDAAQSDRDAARRICDRRGARPASRASHRRRHSRRSRAQRARQTNAA